MLGYMEYNPHCLLTDIPFRAPQAESRCEFDPGEETHSNREQVSPLSIRFHLDLKIQMEVKKLLAAVSAIVALTQLFRRS